MPKGRGVVFRAFPQLPCCAKLCRLPVRDLAVPSRQAVQPQLLAFQMISVFSKSLAAMRKQRLSSYCFFQIKPGIRLQCDVPGCDLWTGVLSGKEQHVLMPGDDFLLRMISFLQLRSSVAFQFCLAIIDHL